MINNIKKPNFFIIGAPKCGTTAMAQYLGQHPDIFFSEPKEPCFFCTDFPKERNFTNEDDYLNSCFSQSVGYSTVGEGSPIYLFSKEAVPNILEFNPKAKFIVIVRQPVDLFLSTFYQMKLSQRETASDPEKAWNLQKRRRFGKINQSERLNSKNLSYGDFCKLGEQIERLYQNTQGEQVRLILFDDFKNNTKKVYENILEFLDIPSDGRVDFLVVNKRKKMGQTQ